MTVRNQKAHKAVLPAAALPAGETAVKSNPFRDWVLAASMANLCLLRTWSWLFGDSVLLSVATTLDYVAVFCNVLLLAVSGGFCWP